MIQLDQKLGEVPHVPLVAELGILLLDAAKDCVAHGVMPTDITARKVLLFPPPLRPASQRGRPTQNAVFTGTFAESEAANTLLQADNPHGLPQYLQVQLVLGDDWLPIEKVDTQGNAQGSMHASCLFASVPDSWNQVAGSNHPSMSSSKSVF